MKPKLKSIIEKCEAHSLPLPKNLTRCKGCRYPGVGFICWRPDGTCMRTDIDEIEEKEKGITQCAYGPQYHKNS